MQSVRILWGQRIAAARERVGMTQSQLAGALGVTQQLVSRWEHGSAAPRDERRAHVARVLGERPEALFAFVDDDTNGGQAA